MLRQLIVFEFMTSQVIISIHIKKSVIVVGESLLLTLTNGETELLLCIYDEIEQ